jgi:hypothetical protein
VAGSSAGGLSQKGIKSRSISSITQRIGRTSVVTCRTKRPLAAESQLDRESPAVQTWNEGDVEQSADSLKSSSSMAFVGLAIGLSLVVASALVEPANAVSLDRLHVPLDQDMQALAFNFDPLYDEFWDNTRRFILYFFSVTTGGIYMLVKPVADLFKKPLTAALTVVILGGSFYLVFTVLQLMLGITEA